MIFIRTQAQIAPFVLQGATRKNSETKAWKNRKLCTRWNHLDLEYFSASFSYLFIEFLRLWNKSKVMLIQNKERSWFHNSTAYLLFLPLSSLPPSFSLPPSLSLPSFPFHSISHFSILFSLPPSFQTLLDWRQKRRTASANYARALELKAEEEERKKETLRSSDGVDNATWVFYYFFTWTWLSFVLGDIEATITQGTSLALISFLLFCCLGQSRMCLWAMK